MSFLKPFLLYTKKQKNMGPIAVTTDPEGSTFTKDHLAIVDSSAFTCKGCPLVTCVCQIIANQWPASQLT